LQAAFGNRSDILGGFVSRPSGNQRVKAALQSLLLAVVTGLLAWGVAPAADPDWPQWRGPEGQGHAPAARDLPVTWSETENVAWKTPLAGRGWSSPVIGDGRIWLTTAIERKASPAEEARALAGNRMAGQLEVSGSVTIRAVCLAQASGAILHDVELFTIADPQPIHKLNSFASPSPVLADGRLYCHCGDFGAACLDAATGEIIWRNRELRLNHENGPGSTPVIWRDRLIVHLDGSDVQSIAAYETASGRIAWRTTRSGSMRDDPQLKKAYGTPLIIPVEGRDVVLSPAADWLYAYDPATGEELWKLGYGVLGFSVVPRPVMADGLLFMSTSFMQPELLAVRLGGPATPPEIAWREKKGAPTMSSPLVADGLLYMVNDKGVATCLDAVTGERVWTERLGGNFSSSPLLADGRIYVGNRDGETFVIKPGREFELLATNQLEGGIFATPAAVGRAIFLRTEEAFYRLEKPAEALR
jgi:outer membrane protein assembly factor BamB